MRSTITKAHILTEIARTSKANKGTPLGVRRFYAETGIKEGDWLRYWARWGDALTEAGLTPNTLQAGYGAEHLLELLASFARELGRVPGRNDLQLKAHRDRGFPAPTTFQRLGKKHDVVARLAAFCEKRPDYRDVLALCTQVTPPESDAGSAVEVFGYVYLLKSGRFFKIGRSNAVGRREYELAIQLPEKVRRVHSIKTDDPRGH